MASLHSLSDKEVSGKVIRCQKLQALWQLGCQ